MTRDANTSKSLEQLDGEYWGDPPVDATPLVRTCHAWRRRPIGTLEPHELARLITQDIGLPWLLPIAVAHLRDSAPCQAEGGWYDDDLLYAVVTRRPEAWVNAPDLARTMKETLAILTRLSRYVKSEADAFLASLPDLP